MSESQQQNLDALGAYIRDVREKGEELLSAQEEVELCKKIEAGLYAEFKLNHFPADPDEQYLKIVAAEGKEAVRKLWTANLRLVISFVTKKYNNQYNAILSAEDLLQEGNIGILKAIERFDYKRGYKFSTYAVWRVRQTIGIALESRNRRTSLDIPADESLATISDETDVEDEVIDSIIRDELNKGLAGLTEREAQIICQLFGLTGDPPKKLKEVGRELGLTGERIRQIKNLALESIRASLPELEEYL